MGLVARLHRGAPHRRRTPPATSRSSRSRVEHHRRGRAREWHVRPPLATGATDRRSGHRRHPQHDAEPPAFRRQHGGLARRQHVVADKPLAMDAKQCRRLRLTRRWKRRCARRDVQLSRQSARAARARDGRAGRPGQVDVRARPVSAGLAGRRYGVFVAHGPAQGRRECGLA